MFKKPFLLATALLTILGISQQAEADCLGKIELAPAYIHIDVIHAEETVKELDMAGIRGDCSVVFAGGWVIKPNALYGKEKDGEIVSFGVGFGHCFPVHKCWILTPTVGVSYTKLETDIHVDMGAVGEIEFHERFKGVAPYVGLEVIFTPAPNWRICASAEYAWSYSTTKVEDLFSSKSDSQGPSYGLLVEYDFAKCWSVNIGGAYNESFSKEKNGIRGRGGKIGLVRWF